ncbi:PH domain-containing protein [Kitasatospora sp. NPDC004799]|uniref:PH domain-containing protein n=1 Tax=Kitasatospora sp. NPDC004799 TaxID=3154460 RepID=UPI0033A1243C
MGARELPRTYRANRRKANASVIFMGCAAIPFVITAWTQEIFPHWVKLLVSVATLLLVVAVAVTLPWSGTWVDGAGIRVRGLLRTRRLSWADIEDIRTKPLRPSPGNQPFMPKMVAYAYLSSGRRVLLVHVNDLHLGSRFQVEWEIGVLRAALAELRDKDPVQGAGSA